MVTTSRLSIFLLSVMFLFLHAVPGSAAPSSIRRLGFAIQMGAFADVNNAERFTAMLQAKGIDAFYFRKDNGLYAVRFGDFPTKAQARSTASKLVAEHLINSYYIAPPKEVVFATPKGPGWQKAPPDEISKPRETTRAETARDESDSIKPKGSVPADRFSGKGSRGEKDMGVIAARTAERFVGIPYRWGGENVVDGMDCSGFVRAVYNLCGISIPRTSREQFTAGDPVPKDDLRDGDLVFFGSSDTKINHVGIYVGGGRFVHAPRRGEEIRVTAIDDSYFEKHFVGARRYFQ